MPHHDCLHPCLGAAPRLYALSLGRFVFEAAPPEAEAAAEVASTWPLGARRPSSLRAAPPAPPADPWCARRCPLDEAESLTRHFRDSGFAFRPGSRGLKRCDLCSSRWLFIVSPGGRSGSTTLLNTLNLHPV